MCWPYIQQTTITGLLKTDIEIFLNANGKYSTSAHCVSVSKTSEELAARFGLEESTASVSALLHDISNVLKPQDMLDYAIRCEWMIDEAERKHPFLLHQRLSAVFAQDVFGIDNTVVLSAIGCHSTLKTSPSDYDILLFLADKLSWDQAGTPPFFDTVSSALERSLAYASLVYINYVLDHGMILSPHMWLIDAKTWLEKREIC